MTQSETTGVIAAQRKSMARRALDTLTELRRRMFLTPTESKADAARQIEQINLGLAQQRAQFGR